MAVNALQQHNAFKLGEIFLADSLQLVGKGGLGCRQDFFQHFLVGDRRGSVDFLTQVQFDMPVFAQRFFQPGHIPLLFDTFDRYVLAHQVGKASFAQGSDLRLQVAGVHDVVALLVDYLALVVGHIVVFKQLLANVEVARLHLALRRFDAACHDAGFNSLTIGHFQPLHDGLDAVAGKNAHQRVIQPEVKARGAWVALAARTSTQLVVDTARLMPFGRNNAQTTQRSDLFVLLLPLGAQAGNFSFFRRSIQRLVRFNRFNHFFEIATQHDVSATTCHVGGNRDHLRTSGLRDDVGLARVLLGIEHLMRQVGLDKQVINDFGIFDGACSHQHRLAALITLANILDGRFVLLARGFVHAIELVFAFAHPVGRNNDGFEPVDFLELIGFRVGGTRHARQRVVETEIILESNRGQSLVFGLNLNTLFGFHRLVQAIAPAAARHQATGELVHNDDFALLHHIVLVAVVQQITAQRGVQMMH